MRDPAPSAAANVAAEAQNQGFKSALTQAIPHLRAFARGLCGRSEVADDLVQETLLRAWAARDRFTPGTSMRAWTFTILRNIYLTEMRRNRFRGDYDEAAAERQLVTAAGQEAPLHLADLHRALMALPTERREALLLVGAGGFSYEEAADICGCAVGTIKSRVGRARAALSAMIEGGTQIGDAHEAGDATTIRDASGAILSELGLIAGRKPR